MNEAYTCEDNEDGKLYMGLPISAEVSPYIYGCDDSEFICENKPDSLECLKLNFVCLEELPPASWYIMMVFVIVCLSATIIIFAFLCCYCYLKRRRARE
jgi:hypothetical protein